MLTTPDLLTLLQKNCCFNSAPCLSLRPSLTLAGLEFIVVAQTDLELNAVESAVYQQLPAPLQASSHLNPVALK